MRKLQFWICLSCERPHRGSKLPESYIENKGGQQVPREGPWDRRAGRRVLAVVAFGVIRSQLHVSVADAVEVLAVAAIAVVASALTVAASFDAGKSSAELGTHHLSQRNQSQVSGLACQQVSARLKERDGIAAAVVAAPAVGSAAAFAAVEVAAAAVVSVAAVAAAAVAVVAADELVAAVAVASLGWLHL